MAGTRMVQIIPAGARQVAPGVFQQRGGRRGHGGGKKHHHHRRGGFRSTSMFGGSAAKALQLYAQINGRLPSGMNVGFFLYQWGASRHNLGVQNIGKFLWLQSMAATNPAILQMLSMGGGGDPMMMMLSGGAGGPFGGGFPGGIKPMGGIGTPQGDAAAANALLTGLTGSSSGGGGGGGGYVAGAQTASGGNSPYGTPIPGQPGLIADGNGGMTAA
jgi:hypothetical protein